MILDKIYNLTENASLNFKTTKYENYIEREIIITKSVNAQFDYNKINEIFLIFNINDVLITKDNQIKTKIMVNYKPDSKNIIEIFNFKIKNIYNSNFDKLYKASIDNKINGNALKTLFTNELVLLSKRACELINIDYGKFNNIINMSLLLDEQELISKFSDERQFTYDKHYFSS